MKSTMFNALRAFGIYLLVAVSFASAQSTWIIAKVPFDFAVKNQHFAAGSYSVSVNLAQGVLLVRGEDNGSATFAITNATQRDKAERLPTLVFNRYGDQYFLSQVWPAGGNGGRELTRSKMEEELASRSGKPEVVALLVSGSRSRRPARSTP